MDAHDARTITAPVPFPQIAHLHTPKTPFHTHSLKHLNPHTLWILIFAESIPFPPRNTIPFSTQIGSLLNDHFWLNLIRPTTLREKDE